MSEETPIDRLYQEAIDIISILEAKGEVSLQVAARDHFRKALLLAAASYFEHRVSETVLEFVREGSSGSELITAFVRNQAVDRQFSKWFAWEAKNANHFFGLFGPRFRSLMAGRVKESLELDASV